MIEYSLFRKKLTVALLLKWPIFNQTGKTGTGKNTNYLFFLLGLKYTLSSCFESNLAG